MIGWTDKWLSENRCVHYVGELRAPYYARARALDDDVEFMRFWVVNNLLDCLGTLCDEKHPNGSFRRHLVLGIVDTPVLPQGVFLQRNPTLGRIKCVSDYVRQWAKTRPNVRLIPTWAWHSELVSGISRRPHDATWLPARKLLNLAHSEIGVRYLSQGMRAKMGLKFDDLFHRISRARIQATLPGPVGRHPFFYELTEVGLDALTRRFVGLLREWPQFASIPLH